MLRIALICGGPSLERGISLNSARSIVDHLSQEHIEIIPIYVNLDKNFYSISLSQLYSNTPSDFDFKLDQMARLLTRNELSILLRKVDLVFPVIHGAFGEDGSLQAILEEIGVPFIGSSSQSCQQLFSKHQASVILKNHGFNTLPSIVLSDHQTNQQQVIEDFFALHSLKRAVIKPVIGGSSIGVFSITTPQEALNKCQFIFTSGINKQTLLEPFCEGIEFTIVVLENKEKQPVALLPTEIEMSYANNQIFDYRKKYLPTSDTTYHTPPRFAPEVIQHICQEAEKVFTLFNMRDFARLDGWLMPNNQIYFTDFNPLSGLEQNSFLFRQTAILGLSHQETLEYIVQRACQRIGITFPCVQANRLEKDKHPVYVLFGNKNAERQVSLMSGTNVWLKLLKSELYTSTPFFYDLKGDIWEIPYSYALNHTVEEVYQNCLEKSLCLELSSIKNSIQQRLNLIKECHQTATHMSLDGFLNKAKEQNAFVFIAMHGGEGENGALQRALEKYEIPYNGSNSQVSALCMDKYLTGQVINQLNDPDILSTPKKIILFSELQQYNQEDLSHFWQQICKEMQSNRLIIKPRCDGCSAGIVLLQSIQDLERYSHFIHQQAAFIPAYSFANQDMPIEMPSFAQNDYIIEPYIETDLITIHKNTLSYLPKQGWIELTVGVLEQDGIYHSLNPSITIAEGAVLSLEEKFQGGTGVNLTPPPEKLISLHARQKIKCLIEKIAQALGIQNYARIDIFFNVYSEKIIVIEANTLPGLTPSTVIYHQGLAEDPTLAPTKLLEKIISNKILEKQKIASMLNFSG